MPHLHWIGKEKVIHHHNDVIYRPLVARETFGDQEIAKGNMIIHGDNLEALKSLLPQYEGRVDCIYIDPPYNTRNEGWIYNDNVNDPKIKKWLGEVVGREGEDLSRHDKWLCMMYPRLKLLHRLLAEDGVIFISLDDNEIASLRLIMDEIFCKGSFITTITWKSRAKPSNTGDAKLKPQNDAEYIVVYKKTQYPAFRLIVSGKERSYPHTDTDGNYRLQTILKSNRGESKRETMQFSLNGYTPPSTKRWQAGEDTIIDLFNRNRITFQTGEPMLKYYEHEEAEEFSPFYCHVPKDVSGTAESGKKELNAILGIEHGFDTVKPTEILSYVLGRVHAKKDAVFLDSFAGSGTTAHAILKLNKIDNGTRRFILCEMMDYADSITAERVRRVIKGYGEGDKTVAGLGGGFTFCELGTPLFDEKGNLSEPIDVPKLREYVWYVETKAPYSVQVQPYYLGNFQGIGYYLLMDDSGPIPLTYSTLAKITQKQDGYVVYGESCALSEDFLLKNHITFKKIPNQLARI